MEDDTSVPSSSSTESDSGAVASLLDKLKSPTPSVLARKRAVSANPPPKGKRPVVVLPLVRLSRRALAQVNE